ncbi:MAG TPA: glycosyltransferase family 39 protein [Desulfobulbus sp.]|nr:glycosyltransferase family 39 protein [Desulfobulbus sp.]
MPENRLTVYGWIPLWLVLVITALLCRPPLPIDETRYLSVAWEMWQNHQFLVPHINGLPYSHKPPLLFWLIQAGWAVFGVNDWSARLTAPIFALFSILLTRHLSGKLWPKQRQIQTIVPYLFIGTLFWSFYSTLTMFDMLIGFFSLVAWLGLWTGRDGKRYLGRLVYAAAIGLGILAKGPVILVYTAPPALLAPWWMGREKSTSWKAWYGGFFLSLAAGILLALAWALPAAKAGGAQYGQAILLGQTAGRMVHSFAHQRPVYWYLLLLPLLLFPWPFCPSFWSAIRQLRPTSQVKFCLSSIVPGFFLLSAISGKQIHYLLPLLPPIILLISRAMTEIMATKTASTRLLAMILLLFSLALLVSPTLPLHGGDSEMLHYLPRPLGIIPLITALFFLQRQHVTNCIPKTAAILGTMLIFLHFTLAPSLHALYDAQAVGEKIHAVQATGNEVAVYPARLADQFQFAGRLTKPLSEKNTMEEIVRWAQKHTGQYVLLLLDKTTCPFFSDNGTVQPFSNRWLLFRPASGIIADYQQWKTETLSAEK